MKPVPRLRRPPPRDLAAAVKSIIRTYTCVLVQAKRTLNTASRTAFLQNARAHLRTADPVIARLIDARPDFDPRAWIEQLPPMDLYGALLFHIVGQPAAILVGALPMGFGLPNRTQLRCSALLTRARSQMRAALWPGSVPDHDTRESGVPITQGHAATVAQGERHA
jgi:hypothetical protein